MSLVIDQAAATEVVVPETPFARMRGLAIAGCAIVGLFIFGAGIWSVFAPLESAAIATGTVVSGSHRKTVQHLESGIVAAILVKNGDVVKAGQVLIRLDDVKARTTFDAINGRLWDAEAGEARLMAERDGLTAVVFPAGLQAKASVPAVAAAMSGQQTIFASRKALEDAKIAAIEERINEVHQEIAGYQAEIAAYDQRKTLLQQETDTISALVKQGLERRPRLLELERQLAEVAGKRGDAEAQIAKAGEAIAESEADIDTVKRDDQKESADELRDVEKTLHELRDEARAAADVLARTLVRAPEDGVVTDLRIHTPGGVIAAGAPLLDLVPADDQLVIEAQVRPEDADRVHVGLPAEVRLLPYKERRTPPVDAKVVYISADRLVDQRTNRAYYEAKLRLDAKELKTFGPEVKLIPGMPVEAMIKTGETTVAIYALSPILDSFHRAFRDR